MAENVIELDRLHVHSDSDVDHLTTAEAVSRVSCDISYNEFFEKYLLPNKPCVIEQAISADWQSRHLWTSNGMPNFKYLRENYGHAQVPVADCGEKFYNAQKKSDSCLTDFLTYWEENVKQRHITAQPVLYMKDWHFARDFPTAGAYRVPRMFGSDWLNEFLCDRPHDGEADDYRFMYMGPAGSWTPLHADALDSYSWSVNVCGRKRWLLFPPGQERCLTRRDGRLAYDATAAELRDPAEFPLFAGVRGAIALEQAAGEAVFVPSGWHHQVHNLEDTVSINHNWVNGCNVGWAWRRLQAGLAAVHREVDDCRDMDGWHRHCQTMLAALQGMDYAGFFAFVEFIARRRLQQLGFWEGDECDLVAKGDAQDPVASGCPRWSLGPRHTTFDLSAAAQTLALMARDPDFVRATDGDGRADRLLGRVRAALAAS